MNIGYLLMISSMIIWGSVGIFVRYIDQPPEVIVFFRVFIAFVVLGGLKFTKKKDNSDKKLSLKEYLILSMSGLFIALNWFFFFRAIKVTTIASATMSYYVAPVIVTVLSVFLLKESINKKTLIAVGLSFSGIILMTLMGSQKGSNFNIVGVGYGLIAAFFYALVTISVKKLKDVPSHKISLFQMGISSLIFLPVIRHMNTFNLRSLTLMIIVGVIHTCIALNLYFEGIKRIKVQHVGVLSYIDPLGAVILGGLFFNEMPGISTIIGGGMILSATYIILKRKG
ncbi:DMT family transporter [Psychrilyobacter atlanticus]|uniref:DMT family transporter n=1 Tax=Psychrilyobacter atlanticus TaxID=271091 RepID=UPI00041A6E08|nr:EamA family transporter [Psychrilyobacter atlanticus]